MNRRDFAAAAAATLAAPAIGRAQEVLRSAKASLRLVTLSRGLVQPWSMAFLPDGRMLITERPGRLPTVELRLDPPVDLSVDPLEEARDQVLLVLRAKLLPGLERGLELLLGRLVHSQTILRRPRQNLI